MSEFITVEQLAADETFQNWVNRSNLEDEWKWNLWLMNHPQNASLVDEAKAIVKLMQALRKKEVAHKKKDIALQDMKDRLSITDPAIFVEGGAEILSERDGNRVGRLSKSFRWAAIAAVIVLFSGITAYWYMKVHKIEQVSAFGENMSFVLPDGSRVDLNANSTLKSDKVWSEENAREVWLKGEAFFSVKHKNSNQKFIVHTNNGDIEVLGTSFNVYDRRGKTKVVLTSGKVKIVTNKSKDTLFLNAGEMVEFTSEGTGRSKIVDGKKFTSWKDNLLVFDDATLQDVAVMIKDNYGYEVKWEKENLKKIKFSYTFVGKDVDLLLTTLSEALDIIATKKEDTIFINQN